jgi:predicted small secreted protein
MKRRLSSLFPLLVAVWLVAGATGCNTMQGIGADIAAAGDAIEGSAKKSKSY